MKKLKMFYLENCPYCRKAFQYLEEVMADPQYQDIEIEKIEERRNPEIANAHDYYYVPTFYHADKKLHEGATSKEDIVAILNQVS